MNAAGKRRPEEGRVRQDNVNRITGEVEVSLTKQEMGAACDINNIMKKYEKTGEINHMSLRPPQYGNFASTMSFQQQRNAVIEATATFEKLPAKIRTYFDNDPAKLVDFMADPANEEAGKQLGLYAPDDPGMAPATTDETVVEPTPEVEEPVAPEETDT